MRLSGWAISLGALGLCALSCSGSGGSAMAGEISAATGAAAAAGGSGLGPRFVSANAVAPTISASASAPTDSASVRRLRGAGAVLGRASETGA